MVVPYYGAGMAEMRVFTSAQHTQHTQVGTMLGGIMTGAYSKVVIESCPYDTDIGCCMYRSGATFGVPDVIDMIFQNAIPSGTYWLCDGVRYLFYDGIRYALTEEGDIDENTAMKVSTVITAGRNRVLRWVAV